LFVAYLQLFNSSMDFFKQITFNTLNVYRSALPLFVGIIIMTFPASYFESFLSDIRSFICNGLLVGIILALIIENVINCDRFASSFEKSKSQNHSKNTLASKKLVRVFLMITLVILALLYR